MGAVDFHAVHADALGILGRLGEGADHVLDVLLGHAVHDDLSVLEFFRRAISRHAGVRFGADAAHATDVPQLRNDLAALGMYRVDDFFPTGQGCFTKELRHIRVTIGRNMADGRAFGDDQANAGSSATTVVLDDFGVRYAARRKRTGHRRHDHTGRQFESAEVERFEQGLNRHGKTPQGMTL